MTAAESYMDALAELVADKVEQRLRRAPIVQARLLSVEDAATVLGRTPAAIRQMLTTGKLRNSSPDSRVQIDSKDIDLLITNSKR